MSASPDATVLLEEGLRVLVHHILQASPKIVRQMIRNQAAPLPHEDLIRAGALGAKAGIELRSLG